MLGCAWFNPRFDVYESRCNLNLSRDSKVRNISLNRDCRPHFDHLRAHPSSAIREGVTGRVCIGRACDISTDWARTAPNRGNGLISSFFAHSAPAFDDAGTAVRALRMTGEHRVVSAQPTLSETNKGPGYRATLSSGFEVKWSQIGLNAYQICIPRNSLGTENLLHLLELFRDPTNSVGAVLLGAKLSS